jgi:CheY-like chemotaxis protein
MSQKTILLIEDDDSLRLVISQMLDSLFPGVKVVMAPDGLAGLKKFEEEKPDFVLCDVKMPGMDGIQVLAVLHNLVSVVMMTGYSELTEVEILQRGAKDVLIKPFNSEKLHNILAPYLEI